MKGTMTLYLLHGAVLDIREMELRKNMILGPQARSASWLRASRWLYSSACLPGKCEEAREAEGKGAEG